MSIQKLNDALGLGDKGIDGFLADLNVDNSSFQDKFSEIDSKVKENVDNIDNQIQEYNKGGLECLDVANLNSSLSELKELIVVSKGVIKQVYETIQQYNQLELQNRQRIHNSKESELIKSKAIEIKEQLNNKSYDKKVKKYLENLLLIMRYLLLMRILLKLVKM